MRLTHKQLKQMRDENWTGPNRLRRARELAGLTQVELAKALACEQTYISKVECGTYSRFPLENARLFAEFFGCQIEDLFPARESVAS